MLGDSVGLTEREKGRYRRVTGSVAREREGVVQISKQASK